MDENQEQSFEEMAEEPGKKQQLVSQLHYYFLKLKSFYVECLRVWKITRRPDRDEFKTIVKISGLGILLIGVIGFIVHFVKEVLF